jgi:hypothetical protein
MTRLIIIISFFIITYSLCCAQTDESVYLRSIMYISSNPSIRSEVAKFFKRDIKPNMCVSESFWISKETPYIDIRLFSNKLYIKQIFLHNDTVKSDEQYRTFYQGLTNKTDLTNLATVHEQQPLRLVFSKVFGNVVLAELLLDHDPRGSYKEVTKLGRGLRLLIYFDKSGKVLNVFTAGITYG